MGYGHDGSAAAGKGAQQGPGRYLPAAIAHQQVAEIGLEAPLQSVHQGQGPGHKHRYGQVGLAKGVEGAFPSARDYGYDRGQGRRRGEPAQNLALL